MHHGTKNVSSPIPLRKGRKRVNFPNEKCMFFIPSALYYLQPRAYVHSTMDQLVAVSLFLFPSFESLANRLHPRRNLALRTFRYTMKSSVFCDLCFFVSRTLPWKFPVMLVSLIEIS